MITMLKWMKTLTEKGNSSVWCKRLRNFCFEIKQSLKHGIQNFFYLTASTSKAFSGGRLKSPFCFVLHVLIDSCVRYS